MKQLAILGGKPVRRKPYPQWPVFDQRDIDAVSRTIQSGRWGGLPYPGLNTAEFAKKFSELQGGGYAVPMINGTITMEVALRAAGIGWGDEVIVPAYTFQATAYAPMAAGAIPVIVDIDPDTYCIDPEKVQEAITEKTRAIIVVHLAAQMADMDAIMSIAEKHDLIVIEDAAHAHGARWRDQGSGTIGDFGSFSLQSLKSITTGEGGVLLCKDKHMAERAASIIDCGRPKDKDGKEFTMGVNYRMSELHAALGVVALERFPKQFAQRAQMANYLEESLSEVPGIQLLKRDLRLTQRSLYRYVIKMDPEYYHCNHDMFCKALSAEGIPVDTGYPAMHRYELFQPRLSKLPVPTAFPEYFDFENMSLPITERASEKESVWMGEAIFRAGQEGIDDIIKGIQKLAENKSVLEKISRS
ncbi:MAG: DegT/DnrJ/EryC1/StrS family aminotransferase [Chloroflexota bacterium]|jgi:dTDP-4-amino-4,6-dideoxygalactose transaminase|nr:DegT/DnrJ/EryC1/StrS family aminotransferase [Chloroflexota bacterium]